MSILTSETEQPLAAGLTYVSDRFTVRFTDGRLLTVPLDWYPRLQHASAQERANWRVIGGGTGLHWPDIEEDISVAGLLAGRRSLESQKSFAAWLAARPKKAQTPP